jgi:hypothetical protein
MVFSMYFTKDGQSDGNKKFYSIQGFHVDDLCVIDHFVKSTGLYNYYLQVGKVT